MNFCWSTAWTCCRTWCDLPITIRTSLPFICHLKCLGREPLFSAIRTHHEKDCQSNPCDCNRQDQYTYQQHNHWRKHHGPGLVGDRWVILDSDQPTDVVKRRHVRFPGNSLDNKFYSYRFYFRGAKLTFCLKEINTLEPKLVTTRDNMTWPRFG